MGNSVNTATNVIVQTSTNDIYQASSSICLANCNDVVKDVNIIIRDSTVPEGVKITQECTASSLCMMKNQLDSVATQQLEAAQLAEAKAPGNAAFVTWPGVSINTATNFTTQVLSNAVTQVIDSVCQSNVNNTVENVNIYLDNSDVQGIEISQKGEAEASCAIENIASTTVSQKATAEQTAESTAGSALVVIFMIIAIATILIALAWIAYETKKSEKQAEVQELSTLAPYLKPGSLSANELVNILHGNQTQSPGALGGPGGPGGPVPALGSLASLK